MTNVKGLIQVPDENYFRRKRLRQIVKVKK